MARSTTSNPSSTEPVATVSLAQQRVLLSLARCTWFCVRLCCRLGRKVDLVTGRFRIVR
jgi:hypothetical protein